MEVWSRRTHRPCGSPSLLHPRTILFASLRRRLLLASLLPSSKTSLTSFANEIVYLHPPSWCPSRRRARQVRVRSFFFQVGVCVSRVLVSLFGKNATEKRKATYLRQQRHSPWLVRLKKAHNMTPRTCWLLRQQDDKARNMHSTELWV